MTSASELTFPALFWSWQGNIKCRFDGSDKEYTKVNSLVKHVRNRPRVYLSHCGSDLESDCFSGKYIL